MSHVPIDITGQTFGSWTVVSYWRGHGWLCRCECGTEKIITGSVLRRGDRRRCQTCHLPTARRTHGGVGTRLYNIWCTMIARCENPKTECYHRYGGRGITVCSTWRSDFAAFREWAITNGYADHLSIDRKDNDLGYAPDNCRWASATEQGRNTRTNKMIEYRGERLPVAAMAERHSVNKQLLVDRLLRGWSVERAIETPARDWGR